MKKNVWVLVCVGMGLLLPVCSFAGDGFAGEIKSLHSVLDKLYGDMLPLCRKLIGVGRGIAGFAAMWYIASRVWRHIASAEPIDFYPLLRPFVLGFAVLIFPSVIALINGVMKPTVSGTAAMVEGSNRAIELLLKQKEAAIKQTALWQMYVGETGSGDRDKWYKYTHPNETPSQEGMLAGIGNDVRFAMAKASYNFSNTVKQWLSEILRILFEAASLCINTIRTFYLIVLAILGPLVFGIAVFDGFQHTLTVWLARYINIFLWLPVANIFGAIIGKIQENMLKADIAQVKDYGDTFFSSTDTAYLIFMVIGIVGYFTVPSVANYIVNAGGGNTLLHKTTTLMSSGSSMAADTLGAGANRMSSGMSNFYNSAGYFKEGYEGGSAGQGMHGAAGRQAGSTGAYMHDKLSGN